ncbi:MAG TPA: DEAD/DEAH box helicase [Solirubrobacteraceae bacterium]|nr:DEAD/DEAH box helicase [Solirubrobacteraceae bacterium]
MQSFSQLGVSRAVADALRDNGIERPFPIQSKVIGDVLAGRDVLVRSPTGSGKTLAFGIPLVDRIAADGPRPAGLILAPTRELATQITEDLRPLAHARALRITAVYGGVGLVAQCKNAARSHLLVATPGRLEDLLARGAFSLDAIRMLVLDEADRMLDMGFKPAVDRIVRACPARRQTLFFSATLDGEAGAIARRYTADPRSHEHGEPARRVASEIEHRFVAVGADRLATLTVELEAARGRTIVFVRTKRGADRLAKRLGHAGVTAVAMHGDRSQRQREQALARFEAGDVGTLVATDVAARGIDVAHVTHVINFDPPHDHGSYVHRVGRTGRAGRRGVAITLVDDHQRAEIASLADALGVEHELGRGTPSPRSGGPHGARRRSARHARRRPARRAGGHRAG